MLSFLQGAAKVSLLMVGQQAIMDAYLCLLHLTAGIVVESLFNAFATAAFFKFVIFSIFEMRYLLSIWKARRPASTGDGWESMRRELSILYSRFCEWALSLASKCRSTYATSNPTTLLASLRR